MIADFRSCKQKFALSHLQHWRLKSPNVHLHAGAAFARGLEVTKELFYGQGMDPDRALEAGMGALLAAYGNFECPEDSAKSAARMAGALEYYFSIWPLGQDHAQPAIIGGAPAIEFSFAQPLPINHPVTGDPLIYAGRADMIADTFGGRWICDDKTTSQLGASWPKQWDLRSQFTAYCWAAREAGLRVDGVLVRGVSILKTKYDHAEYPTYRPEWQLERWFEQTQRDIQAAIRCWEEGYWDWALDHACNEYSGCPMRTICLLQDANDFIEVNYERRKWDPLTRVETLVDSEGNPLSVSTASGLSLDNDSASSPNSLGALLTGVDTSRLR